jgi:cellulose synthase/poly-beta-1,6-N-acetylglucosamine synthase-like glycosyltransferase
VSERSSLPQADGAALDGLPRLSIVIATRDRPEALSSCLAALDALDYPRESYEVIVVDDGSDSDLAAVVARGGENVRLIRQDQRGPAGARNRGASEARFELLAFTDDDCRPAPSWLRELIARMDGGSGVGGRTLAARDQNPYSVVSQAIVDVVYGFYNRDPDAARFFASNNIAFPADGFHELGGFDERFRTAEDRELCDRWVASGRTLRFAPGARVVHDRPLTLAAFFEQFFRYGRGAFRFHRKRRAQGRGLGMLAELSFYARLPRAALNALDERSSPRLPLGLALIALWQVSNLLGFLTEAGSHVLRRTLAASVTSLTGRAQDRLNS